MRLPIVVLFLLASAAIGLDAQAPSQRELNGFVIGQHRDAIAASFDSLIQADTTADGWIDRAYVVDRAHHAYMAFKFPKEHRDLTISVQIAGDSGTPMLPFLGLKIGDNQSVLRGRLGTPSRIEHESDVDVDLYEYADRNYSFEVTRQGRISSIQIFAYDGFPKLPTGAPSIDSLVRALAAGGQAALDYLMGDMEVYRGGKTIAFTHGALADLTSPTAAITRVLSQGPTSVAAILRDSTTRARADISVRVWEQGGTGMVWKFPAPTPIEELVYKADHGAWRVWEIRYR